MDTKLIITLALLAFVISLAAVGAYIDILTEEKNKYIGYASVVTLLTVGMFTIIFLILLGLCYLINLFV